jgi:DNA-binding transcriptional MerR regulator
MTLLFFKRKKKEKEEVKGKDEKTSSPTTISPSLKIEKSFSVEDVNRARSELRVSSVEKEILSESLTRLYEAAAEGRITPEERDRLVAKYREQLSKIDSVLDYNQKIISLYELEETRAELVKMFQEKFQEVNTKIEEIRRKLGLTPKHVTELKLTPTSTPKPVVRESKPSVTHEKPSPPPSPAPRRSKADEELEKLRQDLQKELEKLEQIELEG